MKDKKEREKYIEKLNAQLIVWNTEIERLKKRLQSMPEQKNQELRQLITTLHNQRELTEQKIKKLQRAGDEAWGEIKDGVERSWNELKTSLQNAREKLK